MSIIRRHQFKSRRFILFTYYYFVYFTLDIVSVSDVYGGTSRYMTQVANVQQGVSTTFIDMSYSKSKVVGSPNESEVERKEREEKEDNEITKRVEDAITPDTKLIWCETPTNPLLSLVREFILSIFHCRIVIIYSSSSSVQLSTSFH